MLCLTRDVPEQFAACWARTVSAFPGTADGLKQEAYYQELADLPIASVEHAAAVIRRMESFLPSAGHWFRIADNHAAEQLVTAAPERALAAGPDPREDALTAAQRGYDAFLAHVGTLCGDEAAQQWATRIRRPQQASLEHCDACRDTGLTEHVCTAEARCDACQQRGAYLYAHNYVRRCHCVAVNTVLIARRQRERARRTRRTVPS